MNSFNIILILLISVQGSKCGVARHSYLSWNNATSTLRLGFFLFKTRVFLVAVTSKKHQLQLKRERSLYLRRRKNKQRNKQKDDFGFKWTFCAKGLGQIARPVGMSYHNRY